MTESEESWQERVAAVAQIVRRGLPQFIGFELFLRVIALAIFTPLTAWLSARLIAWSGDGAISNYDIAGFLISINGLLYLTAVVSIAFALLFFEFGGLVALAIGLQRSEGIRLPQLFRLLGLALPRLWGLAVRQFLTYLARAVPSLVVTGIAYQVFLTKNDINYYLIAKPPQFWIALALASAAAVTWAFFAIRLFIDWIHSVPLLLFGGLSPAAAMKESKALVAGKRRGVTLMLLRWLAATLLMFLTFWLLMAGLKFALLEIAGQRVGLTLGVIAILAVVHFLGAGVVGIIAPELDNPIFAQFVHAIDGRLARRGFAAQLAISTTETVSEERHVELLLANEVDGIIFVSGGHADTTAGTELYAELVERNVPMVLVNGRETGLPVPTVQRLVSKLTAAGLLRSVRGAGGGTWRVRTDMG